MTATASDATESTEPTGPSEAYAREGYIEMVRLLKRARPNDGLRLGDPKDVLVGITLDRAAPVFIDPFALDPAVFGILGDKGTGKTFIAELLRLRASWCYPKKVVEVAEWPSSVTADFTDEEAVQAQVDADGTSPVRWPDPTNRSRAIIATVSPERPSPFVSRSGLKEWPFKGLILRSADPPQGGLLTAATRDWLSRARTPQEAGYGEGVLLLTWIALPIAVVASTPEYEFLRARGF